MPPPKDRPKYDPSIQFVETDSPTPDNPLATGSKTIISVGVGELEYTQEGKASLGSGFSGDFGRDCSATIRIPDGFELVFGVSGDGETEGGLSRVGRCHQHSRRWGL
jgi:hypothetical protein